MQACAVNTVAHELTHTVIEHERSTALFTDTGTLAFLHRIFGGSDDLVSYGLGTLAECVYLEQAGNLTRDSFRSCLAARSLSSFVGCEHPMADDGLDELIEASGC